MNIVDIIIPVYRGLDTTRTCIESVLSAVNIAPAEVVVIDDASPEPEISRWLDTLARDGRITLLRNDVNRGFVVSVNRGMQLHPERDVILLNSDTEVAGDWVDRLRACAAGELQVASATPFSNNATLASYPCIGKSNALPPRLSLKALDDLFRQTNRGRAVDIPTGVGFCLYLKRAALDAVGLFDETAFGRGYGEENDWCLRASAAGYTHRLCGDTFVYHRGEVSFGSDAAQGKQTAQSVVDARYPEYRQRIADFFAEDPARSLRRAVDIARLATSVLPRILFITHNWGGGTEKHVQDLAALIADRADVLVLRPEASGVETLRWLGGRSCEEFQAEFEMPLDADRLRAFLDSIGLSRVHLHHPHQHPRAILQLAAQLKVPLDITLHDYFPLTPQYHLSPGGEIPGGDIDNLWGLDRTAWRREMTALLAGADRVICPSQDLAARIAPHFPGIRLQVWPHPNPLSPPDAVAAPLAVPVKVLVLGGLTLDKGLDAVRDCARDAKQRGLPLFFKIIGHTEHALQHFPELPLAVHGGYREADLSALIALERADAIWFPARIPESFSYTLTTALRTDLPIVAADLGAFPERLRDVPGARLLPWDALPADWNAALLAASQASAKSRRSPLGETQIAAWNVEYAVRYLAPLLSPFLVPASEPRRAMLADRHFYRARHLSAETEKTLATLYAGGVECGHAGTLRELKRRVGVYDAELAHARESAEGAHNALHRIEAELKETIEQNAEAYAAHVQALEAELAAARAAYVGIETSTSWRLTAPLRDGVLRLRRWRERMGDWRRRVKRLPHDAAIAGQILKEEGVVALGRRVHSKLARRNDLLTATRRQWSQEPAIRPLALLTSETPRWSLIVPVYGQALLTYTCLKSIADTCAGRAIEVIVIDDCSPEPTADALREISGVRFIRNDTNLGFLKSCNRAAAAARGEFVVILNNDLILTGDWLDSMTAVFDRFADSGMVGAKLIYPDGSLQEAGGIVWRDGSAWNLGRGDDPDRPEYNYLREVDYCSGACIMLRRDLWNGLSGFDEAFAPAYYEDTDLAFRVRAAGRKVYYQPHAIVVHFEGQSSGTDLTQGVKRHQVINQKTFAARYQSLLMKHRLNGLSPQLERDRQARRRVLVIDACMLTPDQDSGSLRMFEMLGVMRGLGCKVTFVADNLEYRLPYVRDIQALGVEVLHHPYADSITGIVDRAGIDYDVVMLSRATVAVQHIDRVRQKMPQAKIVFDTVDLHFLRQERQAELSGDEAQQRAAQAMQKQELDIIAKADVTLVVSPVEQQLLEQLAPRARIHIVSNIHVPMPGPAAFAERAGILFIGGFRHPPNLDAIKWYVENVLPILRTKQPGLVTTVIGSSAPPQLQKMAAADFVVAGFVADVTPHYQRARISISPLRYGAGVKGKVNLAMQYGVPVVATSCSVEGMHLAHEHDVLVADDPEAFADAIIRLHTDEALWDRLRVGGLANIDAWFSRDTARRALLSVLDLPERLA